MTLSKNTQTPKTPQENGPGIAALLRNMSLRCNEVQYAHPPALESGRTNRRPKQEEHGLDIAALLPTKSVSCNEAHYAHYAAVLESGRANRRPKQEEHGFDIAAL